jgi:hypothetical protein
MKLLYEWRQEEEKNGKRIDDKTHNYVSNKIEILVEKYSSRRNQY